MAAVIQVLCTIELLENILLMAPPKDVLLAQRVCKDWRRTIKGSMKLQRLLFFRPVGEITDGPSRGKASSPSDPSRHS